MMSTMSMSRINRLGTTPQTIVPPPRYTRSEDEGINRKELQPKIIKRRKNVSKSNKNAYPSSQERHTVGNITPIQMAQRRHASSQFPAEETFEGGELTIDDEELDKLAEQVYEFEQKVNQLHDMTDYVKWVTYRNFYLVIVIFIVYIIISGRHPPAMMELIGNMLNEEYEMELYYGLGIFNVLKDMGTVVSSRLMEPVLDLSSHFEKQFP